MERLSALDASFLHVETASLPMHIASVGIYEGPVLSHDEIVEAITRKLGLVPRYRQKVRFVPLGLGTPVWVDDPDFSLEYHIRHTALPAPGGDEELQNLAGRVLAQMLDRDRPLWEMWVVEGLPDERWALITKVHHCMADGVSSTDLMAVLLDASPEPGDCAPVAWHPEDEPGDARLIAHAVGDGLAHGYQAGRELLGAAWHPASTLGNWVHVGRALAALEPVSHPAPPTSLNGPVGRHRRWSLVRTDLAEVKAIRAAFATTINDVVLAAITNGFRELLMERGEDIGTEIVRTLVPVSVRGADEHNVYDNRVSAIYAELPIDESDPLDRLLAVHAETQRLKKSSQADGGQVITSLGEFAPSALMAMGGRLAASIPQRNIQTVTTNVPGPRFPLYLGGRRLIEAFPVVPLGASVRIGVAVMSYEDQITYGISGDYDTTADIDVLCRGIEQEMADLAAAAAETTV